LSDKIELLKIHNADQVAVIKFTKEFAAMAPEDFVNKVLVEQLKATTVIVGQNFTYGFMAAGNVDIAVGLLPSLTTGFFQRRLFKQRYVCLFRQGHPIARNPISLTQYKALQHVGVTSANTGHSEVDEWMTRKGIARDIHLHVPHFVAVGHILQSSDLIATVPERFAQKCAGPFQLETSPLPFKLPEIAINLFWHAKYNREPANMWLRQRIIELFSEHYGQIPIGLNCHIIFATEENGNPRYAIKQVTISAGAVYNFTLSETTVVTQAQLTAAINALP
jgi:hypothetical protein